MYGRCKRRDCKGWFLLPLDGTSPAVYEPLDRVYNLPQVKKHLRAQEIAREHGLPCVYVGTHFLASSGNLEVTWLQWNLEARRYPIKPMFSPTRRISDVYFTTWYKFMFLDRSSTHINGPGTNVCAWYTSDSRRARYIRCRFCFY
jgi:hypothetical protein